MSKIWVYVGVILFFLLIMPMPITHYIYVNSGEKYVGMQAYLFKFLPFLKINNVKNHPLQMQVNGKRAKMNGNISKLPLLKIIKCLYFTKLVQVTDVGLQEEKNIYFFFVQHFLTEYAYQLWQRFGTNTKLKQYSLLNECHSDIVYYGKVETVLNGIIVIKIIFIIVWEKWNERKIKIKAKK